MGAHKRLKKRFEATDELRVWRFVADYSRERGYAPSLNEIGKAVFVSRGMAVFMLEILHAWGVLERIPKTPRAIKILIWPEEVFDDEKL